MFVLAGSAGTAIPAGHIHLATVFALVLGGGATSWLVHMCGALWDDKDPERRSVATATREVSVFIRASHQDAIMRDRHRAALALHDGWVALVNRQPDSATCDASIVRLRNLLAQAHVLFAEAVCQHDANDGHPRTPSKQMQAETVDLIAARASSANPPKSHAEPDIAACAASIALPLGDADTWRRATCDAC
jgi:hypothetical protein